MEVKTIGVIGAGTMGRGIAYAAALAGYRTILEDVMPEMLAKAKLWIAETFAEGVKREKLTTEEANAAVKRIETASTVEQACRESDFLIEAVPEEMELKLELYTLFDKFAKPAAVLASNTSSLSIAEMAEMTYRPELCVGMHFFNPVPKMKLIEVVDLVGLDVRLNILEYLHSTLGEKYRPNPLLKKLVADGRLGRKSGRGVYEYPETLEPK